MRSARVIRGPLQYPTHMVEPDDASQTPTEYQAASPDERAHPSMADERVNEDDSSHAKHESEASLAASHAPSEVASNCTKFVGSPSPQGDLVNTLCSRARSAWSGRLQAVALMAACAAAIVCAGRVLLDRTAGSDGTEAVTLYEADSRSYNSPLWESFRDNGAGR